MEPRTCKETPIWLKWTDSASATVAWTEKMFLNSTRVLRRSSKSSKNSVKDACPGIYIAKLAGSSWASPPRALYSTCATALSISREKYFGLIDWRAWFAQSYLPTLPRKTSRPSYWVRKYRTAGSSLRSWFLKMVQRNFSSSVLRCSITCSLVL